MENLLVKMCEKCREVSLACVHIGTGRIHFCHHCKVCEVAPIPENKKIYSTLCEKCKNKRVVYVL